MTLLDLFRLLRRYLALVIALPLLALAVCGVVLYVMSSQEDATPTQMQSRIIVNSQVQPVAGIAASEGRQAVINDENLKVEAKADTATMTVTITVSNADKGGAVDLPYYAQVANSIADKAVATAEYMYEDNTMKENATVFKAQVEYANPDAATQATTAKSGGKLKYLLVALLGGLFVAICIVVIIDMVKRPVKSIEGVQDAVELPVLEKLPVSDDGERLLANVRFASKKERLGSVCVVPVKHAVLAEQASDALATAAEKEGLKVNRLTLEKRLDQAPVLEDGGLSVIRCVSLIQGMSAAYAGQHSDAVLLTVSQWSDSMKELESAVAEFKLADTNLVGIVFALEVKSK